MSETFATPERVPLAAAERLLTHLSTLTARLETALAAASAMERPSSRCARLLTLLQDEQRAAQGEVDRFAEGDREPLLRHAAALCTLARRMDGYDLGFAGEETAAALAAQRQLLVLVAWQIAAAGSGSLAAGL